MSALKCGMMARGSAHERWRPCGKPASRVIREVRGTPEGCCDQCFDEMLRSGGDSYEELDALYPRQEAA